jgi:3-oxoadipate enol-lactonase
VDGPKHSDAPEHESAPWVVLSNSLATTLEMWDGVAARLAQHYRVLRYDQRGHGLTAATPGPYSFEQLVSDLERLLDALSIRRAYMVGLSMGGTTALGLALRSPERVAGLALCDTSATSNPAGAAQWRQRCELARRDGADALVEPTISRWFPESTIAAGTPAVHKARGMIAATSVDGFCGGAAALSDVHYGEEIAGVTVATAFLVGSEDGVLPEVMLSLHKQLPGSRYAEIPGAGHLSALERPELFSTLLEQNLLAVEAS